jgi:hypothetical protein
MINAAFSVEHKVENFSIGIDVLEDGFHVVLVGCGEDDYLAIFS